MHPAHLTQLDWVVIALYGLGMLAVGWAFSRRTTSSEDYLLGGRRMRSSSVGLSLFATLFSTITYLALPGEMIAKGPVMLWSMVSIPVVYLIVGYMLIPQFMRLRVTSAYEILETRLGLTVRMMGSVMFLLTRLLWMALIIYLTAEKLIVVMLDWPASRTPYVAAVIGLVTVVYTSMGGLRAVVFTDVVQSFILLGGALLSLVLITVSMGGVGAWWPTEWSPYWDQQPVLTLDLTQRVTVVGSIVSMLIWWVCTAGSDQMAIQRYLATRDLKAARRMFLVTAIANIGITLLLAAVGFALLAFFEAHPEYLKPGMSLGDEKIGDIVFPYYIIQFIPQGLTGLVIAGLLAAAMSSLSSGINSSCSVISVDFFNRFRGADRTESQATQVRRTKIIAVASGLLAVLLSMGMGKVTGNILAVTYRTNHIFVAPMFALFFMAMAVPFATGFGTALGAVAGAVVAVLIAYWDMLTGGPPLSFQWITLFSLIASLAVALPASWLTHPRRRTLSQA